MMKGFLFSLSNDEYDETGRLPSLKPDHYDKQLHKPADPWRVIQYFLLPVMWQDTDFSFYSESNSTDKKTELQRDDNPSSMVCETGDISSS